MLHQLKIEPEYLQSLLSGSKRAEIRLNDRDYQVEDILEFHMHDMLSSYHFAVTHIHSGLGMQPGYVVLSVKQVQQRDFVYSKFT